jgi:flagellar motility protein MotE (MotC chaperone)
MKPRLRLIPTVLAAAVLLLGVKVTDVWEVVRAQTSGQPATSAAAPSPGASEPGADADAPDSKDAQSAVPAADPLMMSPSEIEVLQKLSERRATLDKRAQDMAQQEVVLKAAEQRVDEKLAKLKTMETEIGGLVDQKQKEGDDRLKGLVKIYETMKAREASRIFEEMDTPTVLDVLGQMKEAKAAAILASMDPAKAKTVTAALIARRQQQAAEFAGKPANP